jgi:DNA-binding SARP family transcriptional activator
MGLLWPEIGERPTLNNLRVTLHRLGQTLDETVTGSSERLLTITHQTVQLNPAEMIIDVSRFQKYLAAAMTHRHPDRAECSDCLGQLIEAAGALSGRAVNRLRAGRCAGL